MIVSNLELIPGQRIVAHLGIVQGSTVRAKHVGKDIFAGLKNIVGGELRSYTELMQEARQEATDRMIAEARSIGANAVLNVRFATTSIAVGAAEILAYGSAVKLEETCETGHGRAVRNRLTADAAGNRILCRAR
jgi:uncharacterized protein YbjQ (UPF0145 family)